ncbi:substrate-binding periplasmic protein [Shewanella atlantica]|uniref:substrate-binding periplasmic protein n=1 Tax=Shewanella atlantica TaxID=271099 RepID=UPI003734E5CB
MSRMSLVIATLIFITPFISPLRADTRVITLWNYYLTPPFLVGDSEGLAIDFVNLLNDELAGKFEFRLISLPRARLNKYLAEQRQGVVLFVNWRWMGDDAENHYLWTPAIWQDRNEVISSSQTRLVFHGPESLKGLTLVAVRGRQYQSLKPMLARNEIKRFDVNREKQALDVLLKGRGDLTIQPRSVAMFLLDDMKLKQQVYLSPKPFLSFTRHMMLTSDLHELHPTLSDFVSRLDKNLRWKKILKKYDLVEGE